MNEEINIEEAAPWLVILITLIGGGLRVLLLAHKGMWLDETFSIWLADHSIGDILYWTARIDQHPPLYYLLLHYWMALRGDTPYAVRLLSVLFGTATIPVIYLIGKRLSGALIGLMAAVLLALSPFNIRFAQETRMYTLLTFNAAIAIYALVRLLTDSRTVAPIGNQWREYLRAWRTAGPSGPDDARNFSYKIEPRNPSGLRSWIARHRWLPLRTVETDLAWVVFILFSAATMLTHNTAILFPVATNIFVLSLLLFQRSRRRPGRTGEDKNGTLPPPPPPEQLLSEESATPAALYAPSFGNWVKAQIGIFLLWSPWLAPFIRQAAGVYKEFWMPAPTWNTVLEALKSFLNAATPTPRQSGQTQIVWLLYALVLGLGAVYYRKKVPQFLLLVALIGIPFLGELIVSLRRPIFYDRTLIWTSLPLLLLLAAGVAQLRFRFLMLLGLAILSINNLFSAGDYYRFMQKEDWNTAAGYVANFAQKDDLILFNANWVQIPFDYYFRSYENQYSIQVEKHGLPEDMFESGILEPKMTESDLPRLMALLNGRKRVWLVYSHNWYTDPQGLIPQTLASKMRLTQKRDFYGGQVQFYTAP